MTELPTGTDRTAASGGASAPASAEREWPVAEAVCPVVRNDWVNAEYKHLVLDAPHGAARALAGQFFHLLCPTAGPHAPFLRRPMSIYRIDRDAGRLEFLYKIVGAGTTTLAGLEPGDALNIFGPLGRGFDFPQDCRHVVQLARGVGLATLAPVAEAAREQGVRTTAILSARSPDLLMSVEDLRRAGAEVVAVTDTDGTSAPPEVEALVRNLVESQGGDFIVTCGSNRLLMMAQRIAAEYNLPGQVALEQRMGCGIGMCFACVREFRDADGTVAYRRVCWDGPVFDLREALSW